MMPTDAPTPCMRMMPNWLLCRPLVPVSQRASGIITPKDFDKNVVSEGVAEIRAAGIGTSRDRKGTTHVYDHGLRPGMYVLYRQFLRFAQPVNTVTSSDFFLNVNDVLATVAGEGTLGLHDEFRL